MNRVLGTKIFSRLSAMTFPDPKKPLSSRNAMDNASKNAGDMISTLQMQYNRGRQAAITNELVDIITGSFYSLADFSRRELTVAIVLINRCKCSVSALLLAAVCAGVGN